MSRYSLRNGDNGIAELTLTTTANDTTVSASTPDTETESLVHVNEEPLPSDEEPSNDGKALPHSPNFAKLSDDENEAEGENPPPKKQKHLSSLPENGEETPSMKKKSKKKNPNSIWTKPTSRRGKKKGKNNHSINNNNNAATAEDTVLITPVQRFPDKSDDAPDANICLSRVYKAEKVELSDDRLTAGSTKGYRMVRATRGVTEGAWYFEVRVLKLGETGHTRLGWSNEKGDLQAPVGYDGNSFGYRDVDGSKVHKALRDKYGEEGYGEGDVIGFYVSLPEGSLYEPKPPHFVWYKGQRYVCAPDGKEDPPKEVPGSEISFFKNGICQGVAFQNLYGGRYYPAASLYTLPNQPNCMVKFNFGPDFEFFPEDFGERPVPRPMIEVPYHGFEGKVENGKSWLSIRLCPTFNVVKEQDTEVMEDVDL